ncbi:MAG TPA: AAA family ATPase [Nodosilinea sp.]|nr:AAA family ATPase [Nodosilinea sp.]
MADRMPVPLGLLVGIPGSGKSSWARAFVAAHPGYCVVSTDALRAQLYGDESIQGDWSQIWQQVLGQWRSGVAAIRRGELAGVIYDATNARRRHRREVIGAARQVGFDPITLVWLDVPLGLALDRNGVRSHPVPTPVITAMHRQLRGAPPSIQEGVDRVLTLGPDWYPGLPSESTDPLR